MRATPRMSTSVFDHPSGMVRPPSLLGVVTVVRSPTWVRQSYVMNGVRLASVVPPTASPCVAAAECFRLLLPRGSVLRSERAGA